MELIKTGSYKAKITGCFAGESGEKKTPMIGIEFELEDGRSIESVNYLTDNNKSWVTDMLVSLNFLGNKLADLADTSKKISDLFGPLDEDIMLVIDIEEFQGRDGTPKQKNVVKFVNVGSGAGYAKFDHKTAVAKFAGYSFDGELMAAKQRKGKPKEKKQTTETTAAPAQANFTASDIPF